MSVEHSIEAGLAALSLETDSRLVEKSASYLRLLEKWNKVTNLTAVRKIDEMVSQHLMDSFAVNPYLQHDRILDVGSGAGLPGIPLALLNPDKEFILIDTNGKKTRFLVQAKTELDLENVEVVQARIESHEAEYGHVVSRAFASLEDFVTQCIRLLSEKGSLLAMKGPDQAGETAAIDAGRYRVAVNELQVPGLDAVRFLLEVKENR